MTDMRVKNYSNVGMNGKHLKMTLVKDGTNFDAIFFSHNSREFSLHEGDSVDIAFTPQLNEFRGNTTVQLLLSALRRHDCTPLCIDSLENGSSHLRALKPYSPDRSTYEKAWWHLKRIGYTPGDTTEEILNRCPPGMAPETYCICISVFREAGLLAGKSGSVYGSRYEKQAGKADIKETATYRRLNGTE